MDVLTALVSADSLLSLTIIYFLLPLWKLKGQLEGVGAMIDIHEERLQSLEKDGRAG